jgi:hypothetical protein
LAGASEAPNPGAGFRFANIEESRSSVRNLSVEFTPLVRNVSVEQTILNPSGCEVNFTSHSRSICGPLSPCHGVHPLVSC